MKDLWKLLAAAACSLVLLAFVAVTGQSPAAMLPGIGGAAWAQDDSDSVDETIVTAPMPSNCVRLGTSVVCDEASYDLTAFCNQFGSMFAESMCYGAINGGSSGGGSSGGTSGSGGTGSSGGGSDGLVDHDVRGDGCPAGYYAPYNNRNNCQPMPPRPSCECGQANFAYPGRWSCPPLRTCQNVRDYVVPAACHTAVVVIAGLSCGTPGTCLQSAQGH